MRPRLFALFVLVMTSLFCQPAVIDVCTAIKDGKAAKVRVRGTGGGISDAAIIFDYTCPLDAGNGFVLPSVVLIEAPEFSDRIIAQRYKSLTRKSVFQAVVEGKLECPAVFKVEKGDDGDIIGANGFGSLGLYRCRLREARFLSLHVLDTQ